MTGTGKSYLACALAHQACRRASARSTVAPRGSSTSSQLARADGTYPRALARLARIDVLVIDDLAVAPVTDAQRPDLLEVLEDRYGVRSTIVTSQLPPAQWHDYLGRPDLGRRHLRPPPEQRPPPRAKGPLARGKKTRTSPEPPRVASLRSRWPGTSGHDRAECVVTMGETRTKSPLILDPSVPATAEQLDEIARADPRFHQIFDRRRAGCHDGRSRQRRRRQPGRVLSPLGARAVPLPLVPCASKQ